MYNDTDNVLVYGGIKFREGLSKHAVGNLIVYANGPDSRQVPFADQVKGTNNSFLSNTVLTGTGQFYGACAGFVYCHQSHAVQLVKPTSLCDFFSLFHFSFWNAFYRFCFGFVLNHTLTTYQFTNVGYRGRAAMIRAIPSITSTLTTTHSIQSHPNSAMAIAMGTAWLMILQRGKRRDWGKTHIRHFRIWQRCHRRKFLRRLKSCWPMPTLRECVLVLKNTWYWQR